MSDRTIACLVLLVVMLLFVSLRQPVASRSELSTLERQMLELINRERAAHGLKPYAVHPLAQKAAVKHAEYQKAQGRMTHFGPGWGGTPGSRLETEGYRWSFYCENVGWYPPNAKDMFDGWMSSSGHKANILSRSAIHVGIGFARVGGDSQGDRNGYWCMVAAAPERSRDDQPDPGPDPQPPDGPGPDPNPYPEPDPDPNPP